MKTQRLAITLIVINLVFLLLTIALARSTTAQTAAPILRGRALELLDERGVVRARLNVKGQTVQLSSTFSIRAGSFALSWAQAKTAQGWS